MCTSAHRIDRRRFLRQAGLAAGLVAGAALTPSVAELTPERLALAAQDQPELRFDPDRAWQHLVTQVEFGPRIPNQPGHAGTRDYIVRELGAVMDSVTTQDFTQEIRGVPLHMSNIIGVDGADLPTKVLLAAHWDTRPQADMDPDLSKRNQPIPGANDGASGVAVLLEVARVLHEAPAKVGVIIVMLDGEDYGPGIEAMFLGSRYYARNVVPDRPAWGILLDMIGDRDLQIPREGYSQQRAPAVNDRIWRAARELGRTEFVDVAGNPILDDHIPLLDAGIPMVDLIDFTFPWWHTVADTPDKCSPASLQAVGQVILRTLYNEQ